MTSMVGVGEVVLLFVFLVPAFRVQGVSVAPTVHIAQGDVQGFSMISRDGRSFHAFNGIPYGKILQRFGVSKPADGWNKTLYATDQQNCVNSGFYSMKQTGSEDCLTVDIYTPVLPNEVSNTSQLPVMVWIHGGGFVEGSSKEYSPIYFMDEDVVLVIINYRLGALGFLNAGVASARGNQGMKDQVLALRWVRDNIEAFSGDKNLVTIFGESAGACSVSMLAISPMAKGLFHRAIIQSGPAIMPFVYHGLNGPDLAKKLGQSFDCPTSDMEYLVKCLQRLDAKLLLKLSGMVLSEFGFDERSSWMGPSIETYKGNDEEVFLGRDPYDIIEEGLIANVPYIFGSIKYEGFSHIITNNPVAVKKLNAQWTRYGPHAMFLAHTAEDPGYVVQQIRDYFLSDGHINVSKALEYEILSSERHWARPFRIQARHFAKHVPIYLYSFTQEIVLKRDHTNPLWAAMTPKLEEGAKRRPPNHADDLPYLFEIQGPFSEMFLKVGKDHEDYEFSKGFVKTWVNFAKTGDPTSTEWGEWSQFKSNNEKWMEIAHPPKFTNVPEKWKEYDRFWDTLSIKEYGKAWQSTS